MLLRSNQLLPGHRYCRQSWGDPPQNQFHIWDQGRRGLAVARVCLLGGVGASSTWHRLSSCGRTGWHPGSYWATRTELEGARGSVCWVSRAQNIVQWAPEGVDVWCRDVGFPFWASQRSWFGESGDTDVLRDVPLDGTDDEGWRDDGFWLRVRF